MYLIIIFLYYFRDLSRSKLNVACLVQNMVTLTTFLLPLTQLYNYPYLYINEFEFAFMRRSPENLLRRHLDPDSIHLILSEAAF